MEPPRPHRHGGHRAMDVARRSGASVERASERKAVGDDVSDHGQPGKQPGGLLCPSRVPDGDDLRPAACHAGAALRKARFGG